MPAYIKVIYNSIITPKTFPEGLVAIERNVSWENMYKYKKELYLRVENLNSQDCFVFA